ncbi:6268_t:CDS:2, partial [Dentiscutata erythropus]
TSFKSETRNESRLRFRRWSLRGYDSLTVSLDDCVLYWPVEECVLKLAVLPNFNFLEKL